MSTNEATNAATERVPQVVVVDIPVDLSAADTAQLMEEHSGLMYLLAVVPWPGIGARAFFRRHALNTRPANRNAEKSDEDKVVDAVVAAHPKTSPGKIAEMLARKGIVRHPLAISGRRTSLTIEALAADAKRGERA